MRLFDLFLSIILLLALMPLLIFIYVILLFESRSPIFVQTRVGKNAKQFSLYKFRTMYISTKNQPTHLNSSNNITNIGNFLRRVKLDELPQLINVALGDMSLVGPRPCLPTQTKLISLRATQNIFNVRPGITGLAQIRCLDMSDPIKLVETETEMINNFDVFLYFKILFLTFMGKGSGDRVKNL